MKLALKLLVYYSIYHTIYLKFSQYIYKIIVVYKIKINIVNEFMKFRCCSLHIS